ncbi:hypothetical protein HPB50_017826 [Hyalomma asiaticum]|uniref:Uncharacterized protein n=1 Tax=Hyalomma asiaticum TaxID=266040 RepID=A0ACB7SXJ1_HYAAI|nr:hypothetical protein HPB50_017826 [Hyalomma asiaticum]
MEPEKLLFQFKRREGTTVTATAPFGIHATKRDVKLLCEGMSIKAHKAVLRAHSLFFEEQLAANPNRSTVTVPSDVSLDGLGRVVEFMYRGEVTVTDKQLYDVFKAVDALKVDALCTLVVDKEANKMVMRSCTRCRVCQRVARKEHHEPMTWTSHTSTEVENSSTERPSPSASAIASREAKEDAKVSSPQLVAASASSDASTERSQSRVEQNNDTTNQASDSAIGGIGYNAKNAKDSSPETRSANDSPVASTSKRAYATAQRSSDALSSDSFDPCASGSYLQTPLNQVRKLGKIVKDSELGHPLKSAQVVDTVTTVPITSTATCDTSEQASDAVLENSTPVPHRVPFSPHEAPSSSGAKNSSCSTETRKRRKAAVESRTASAEEHTEEASWSSPIKKSKVAQLEKQ